MENDTLYAPPPALSLIRSPDAGVLLAAALPVLGIRHWSATVEVLDRLGLVDVAIEADAPSLNRPVEDDGWTHGFAQPDGAMRLSVTIACDLTAWTCARRFGGTAVATAGRRRGGAVERAIARQIADAVRADLGCADWSATDDEPDGPAAVRTLSFAIGGETQPLIRIALTGVSGASPRASPDRWAEQLRLLGEQVRLPVRTVLARPVLSAGEVARLSVGDVIPIRAPDRVALLSGRHKLAVGILDELDGHAAVRLDPQAETQ